MHAIAHEARLKLKVNPKDPNSRTHAQEWAALAARGITSAIEALKEPSYPPYLQYLRDWSARLFGRSGTSMDGVAPLSDIAICAWRQNTGNQPTPLEIEALMLLDAVRRDPSIVKVGAPKVERVRASSKWPTKKAQT